MASGPENDEFDRIVENLDLDLSFPDEPTPAPASDPSPERWTRSPDSDDEEEPFYRRVTPSGRPWRRGTALACAVVLGAPTILVICTVGAYILPRAIVAALGLLFVASVVYLVSQLPERGPADPDDPDDGAVL